MDACLSPNGQMRFDTAAPPTRLFVATATGVAVLERGGVGAPWRLARTGLDGHHVSTMTGLPGGEPGMFAGTHGDGVYFSADGGKSWEPRARGITLADIYSLYAVARAGRTVLYAGTQPAALFRSDDLGASWTELPALRGVPGTQAWTFPAPPHIAHTKMMAFDPRDPDTIYAAIEQGAFLKSTDGGARWREFDSYSRADDRAYKDVHQIVLVPSRPETMFMTTGVGLYRSEDGGVKWERLTGADFRLAYPDHIALSPDEKTLFMSGAAADPGVWRRTHDAGTAIMRSRDGGRHWDLLRRGVPETAPCNIEGMTVVAYPGGYGVFIGDTDGIVYASEDGGDSWTRIASGIGPVSKGNHFEPLRAALRQAAAAH
jgi:photosystem II stability/assembly factor-like uncharacterized protein